MVTTAEEYNRNAEKISKVCSKAIIKHREKISAIYDKIVELQDRCPHYGLIETPGGDTGNWDRNDEYWTDYKCPYCNKQWRTYHDEMS